MRTARFRPIRLPAVHYASTEIARNLPPLTFAQRKWLFDLAIRGAAGCGLYLLAATVTRRGLYLLIRTPKPVPLLSKKETLRRLVLLYGEERTRLTRNALQRPQPQDAWKRRPDIARCLRMQGDLSNCLRYVKQRFSFSYNRARGKYGVVWKDRFASLLIEDNPAILSAWAVYIAARAAGGGDPREPEFCPTSTLHLAIRGNPDFQQSLRQCLASATWRSALAKVRRQISKLGADPLVRPARGKIVEADAAAAGKEFRRPANFRATHEAHWRKMFTRLKQYHTERGHTQFDWAWEGDPDLSRWAGLQRSLRKAGRLNPRRIAALDSIPFEWTGNFRGKSKKRLAGAFFSRTRWETHFRNLVAYQAENGHAQVPRRHSANQTLANWVWRQRIARRKGTLPEDFIRRLDGLGFNWAPRRGSKQ